MKHANVAIFVPHRGCPHQCAFCNQRRISGENNPPDPGDVARILERADQNLGERVQSSQIAFFGGSFTAIPRGEMLAYLEAARPYLGPGGFSGIRVSTRPDAVDAEVLDLLAGYGVNAVELGAQSMDEDVLRLCGRGHTGADVARAAGAVKDAGLELGLQMMTGLPGDTDEKAMATLDSLLTLQPDTMRIYPTLVLEDTPLARLWREGLYTPQTLEQAVELCARLLERCGEAGTTVIRLGLHDGPGLGDNLLAGPRHPAFRELCEGRILLAKALEQLEGRPPGPVTLAVARGSVSRMAGQKGRNKAYLESLGYRVGFREDSFTNYLSVRVE